MEETPVPERKQMPQDVLTSPTAVAAHADLESARLEEPEIYAAGDCWRFRWAGEDRGSFDTEQDARRAAGRHKQQRMMQRFASALERE
jgi:hypothetical protein